MLAAVKRRWFSLVRQSKTRQQLARAEHLQIKKSPNCSKVGSNMDRGGTWKLLQAHAYLEATRLSGIYHVERKAEQRYSLRVRHYCRLWLYTVHWYDTSVYYNDTYTYCYVILYYSCSYWETKPITKTCWSWSLSQIY